MWFCFGLGAHLEPRDFTVHFPETLVEQPVAVSVLGGDEAISDQIRIEANPFAGAIEKDHFDGTKELVARFATARPILPEAFGELLTAGPVEWNRLRGRREREHLHVHEQVFAEDLVSIGGQLFGETFPLRKQRRRLVVTGELSLELVEHAGGHLVDGCVEPSGEAGVERDFEKVLERLRRDLFFEPPVDFLEQIGPDFVQ